MFTIVFLLFAIFLTHASAVSLGGGDDFTNNNFANSLFNDLAPLLTLFGEQVALQFLSHSTSPIENFIFACAPIGLLTSVTAAIRVAGCRLLKAVIGRARESQALAELELMSSTSSDICELWNGVGVVRVVGKPSMLELIYRHGDVGNNDKSNGNRADNVYTLKTAAASGVYKSKSGSASPQSGKDSESGSDGFPLPPNLYLNISGGAAPTWELVPIAVFGALLQLGVFVWDGFITIHPKMKFMPESPSYAFPLTIVGTIGITVGAYICAHVVEASTDEDIWEADSTKGSFRVMWIQPTQFVGDQAFRSYAIHGTVNQQAIRTSRKTRPERLDRLKIWTAVGSILSVISFVLQFIGLRAMHWSAAIAQLIATVVMVVLRVIIRRKLSMEPTTKKLPAGCELDDTAKDINGCQDWMIIAAPAISSPNPGRGVDETTSSLASRVLQTRIELGKLSGWQSKFPETVDQVVRSIQAVMDHLYRPTGDVVIRKDCQQRSSTFAWCLPISVLKSSSDEGELKIILTREKVDNKWATWEVKREEVEAVLSLWMSHFLAQRSGSKTAQSSNLWILGPNTPFNRIIYDWWIYRGTPKKVIKDISESCQKFNVDKARVFSLQGLHPKEDESNGETDGLLAVVTRATLDKACGQFLLACFLKNVTQVIDRLEGKTHVTHGSGSSQFTLISDSIRKIAEAVQQSGLVSTEDAYRLLIPSLREANMLQDPFDILDDVITAFKGQINSVDTWMMQHYLWRDTFERLIYLCNRKAKLLSCRERWADAGRTFMHLIEALSNALGLYDESIDRAREAMTKFAAEFVSASYGTRPENYEVRRKPFRLHAAAAKGYLDLVFEALKEGVEVGMRNDEHETPISLAVKHGHLDTARLLIFYGAPVDRKILYFASNKNQNGLNCINDKMVDILLSNLPNKTELLHEISETGRHIELLQRKGEIDIDVPDSNGFTPLGIASRNGRTDVVKILIDRGADVAAEGPDRQTALHLAVENGHRETINLLVEASANLSARNKHGQTPLHIAALAGYTDIESLALKGADLEVRQKDGQTILHLAAIHNSEEVVRWLLDHGVDQSAKDKNQTTALHLAAQKGHKGIVEMLSRNVDNLLARNTFGQDPLILAAQGNSEESIIRIMVEKGADLTARDVPGRGALEYAAMRGDDAVVRLLIEKGAPLDSRDGFGRTALHYASMSRHASTVRLLIEKGFEIDAADKDGWTALHYACRTDCREVERVLEEAGANILHRDRLGRRAGYYRGDGGEPNFETRALPPPYE
ncbi:hypothetical protein VTN00DRAFT_7519 [Thermoascus crustaceus]|uniref:uncharacterized protein n=1 Tax=Thermoascus crustaceus TaxID=5088 RepID=UPI00374432FF